MSARNIAAAALILALSASVRAGAALAAEDGPVYPPHKTGLFNAGLNYGYPFSQWVGGRLEMTPPGRFGFQFALGVAMLKRNLYDDLGAIHFGWSFGATYYFAPQKAKFAPFVTVMAGMVARGLKRGEMYELTERLFPGVALSAGVRFRGAYCGMIFRRSFRLDSGYELEDMPCGGFYFGWSTVLFDGKK